MIKNCGFVNCQWQFKGILHKNNSKIYGDGKTYDNKLYTFKEGDYIEVWQTLEILVKPLDLNGLKNIPSLENDSPLSKSPGSIGAEHEELPSINILSTNRHENYPNCCINTSFFNKNESQQSKQNPSAVHETAIIQNKFPNCKIF